MRPVVENLRQPTSEHVGRSMTQLTAGRTSPTCPRCQIEMKKVKYRMRQRAGYDCRPRMLAACPTCGAAVDYGTLFSHSEHLTF